jgi:hypothetical protein
MSGKQLGYVLIALIIIGVSGIGVRIISTDSNDFTMSGLLPITSDVIDRVSIASNNSNVATTDNVNLKKINETNWIVGRHNVFPQTLQNFWGHVFNIKNAQLVSREPKYHNRLGVTNNSGSTITFYLGQSVLEQFIVGDTWAADVRLCYIRKSGKTDVYSIPCPQSPSIVFSTNPNLWRNPIIVSIPPNEISSLDYEFSNPNKNYSVTKMPNNDWVIDESIIADTRKIDSMLEILSQFYTTSFENDAVNFDSPNVSIRINTTEGFASKIKFLSKDSESYYVQVPSQPGTIFIVSKEMTDTYLLLDKESLQILPN